jgi:hypothetical protein
MADPRGLQLAELAAMVCGRPADVGAGNQAAVHTWYAR